MGPTRAHLGPIGPRWAPCWPRESRYLGSIHYMFTYKEYCLEFLNWISAHASLLIIGLCLKPLWNAVLKHISNEPYAVFLLAYGKHNDYQTTIRIKFQENNWVILVCYSLSAKHVICEIYMQLILNTTNPWRDKLCWPSSPGINKDKHR